MGESTTTFWDSVKTTLDNFLWRLYDYHREIEKPDIEIEEIWATSSLLPKESPNPLKFFLHYFQSQQSVPTKNECVTTAAVMAMNIMEDRIASDGSKPIQFTSNLSLKKYTSDLDERGIFGWKYRIQTGVPIFEGMMTPWQAVLALRDHAAKLKENFGKSYKVRLRPWSSINDLINHLKHGSIMLIHGAWRIQLATAKRDRHLSFIGGMPHTMLLVGYVTKNDTWQILDPAKKDASIRSMTTNELITGFWGRKFLFYPPRFSITVISPDP